MLYVYNTLGREKQRFKQLKQDKVTLYVCGPTVYNRAHIGNLKTSVVVDFVSRSLRFLGYNLIVTMNLTDVDDKTIRDSQKAGESLEDFTKKYTKIFLEDLKNLRCVAPDNIVPVTTLVPEMVRMIQTMINREFAYLAQDGSIYFDISKSKNYGDLAKLDFSGMKNSVRIDNDEYDKENASDFVLWKAWKESDGENFWQQKFIFDGEEKTIKGRPGWHIECSACNMKYFGPQIDIHMGGEDLVFPHHQNEIAQTEACTGKTFAKYWLHSGHILVDGKKMAKSANNFYTLDDIYEKFSHIPKELVSAGLRHIFLFGKYRDQLNFRIDTLEASIASVKKLSKIYADLQKFETDVEGTRLDFRDQLQIFMGDFVSAIEDNFSSPEALSAYFSFGKFAASELYNGNLSIGEREALIAMFETFDGVFAFLTELDLRDIPQEIFELAKERNQAKIQKDFFKADKIRDMIESQGFIVKDGVDGYEIERKI